jgi:hypothetical protein
MSKFGIALSQPSTWTGLVWLLTVLGIQLDEQQGRAIAEVGMSLVGLMGVFWKD